MTAKVKVFRKPRIGLLSTGNELIDLHSSHVLQPAAETWTGVRDSNRPALRTAIEGLGYEVLDLGIARDT
jgi:gephyrin